MATPLTATAELRFPTREECVVPDLLVQRAEANPDKTFLLFDEEQWSYAHSVREAWRAGNAFQRCGLESGDYLSVWIPTSPDVLRCWFGANAIGATYSPLTLDARGSYLEHTLNLAESKVLVAHHQLLERLVGLELPHLELVLTVGGESDVELPWRTTALDEVFDGASEERPTPTRPAEPWDDLSLIYTSGTTGPSKGVRAAHSAFWNYARCFILPYVTEEDRYLNSLPMYYTAGTGITYSMLLAGGSVALNKGFSPRTFWDDVRRFEATITIAIHGMVTFLLDQPPSSDDRNHTLKTVYMGPLARHDEFAERFGVSIYTAFGMAEVPVPIVSDLNPDVPGPGYCGHNADPGHYELRVVDEHDVPVSSGTPGELIARHVLPWTINSGYKNMPEATANAWRNGWFHTGDEFVMDEDGNFFFRDRKKDVIRRRGVNISSFEVEAEVLSHPLVKEAAAIAVKNPDMEKAAGDEEVMVALVLEPGAELEPETLVDYLAGRMPRHWIPRFVEYLPELPRTPTHKVMKAELRERGIMDSTWDREKAGIKFKREALS
jgi:crotonobetaine/carnitine-CoA ligase